MISVVIPTYNDENLIASTIKTLHENAYQRLLKEVIVVDAGSSDNTVSEAEKSGATVIHCIQKCHAAQMNLGAQHASGKILYFLFPGSMAPKNFTNEIVRATQKGFYVGSFNMRSEYKHWFLDAMMWVNHLGANDARLEHQSLFVTHELFTKSGAFREDYLLMEDKEIIKRLKRYSEFIVLKDTVVESGKKYISKETLRAELSYFVTAVMYGVGFPQKKLWKIYQALQGSKPVKANDEKALTASFN